MLVDSHCHLDFPDFSEEGIDVILKRAAEQGVEHFLTISTKIAEFKKVLTIAEKFSNINCTIGTHPHEAVDENELKFSKEDIIELSKNNKVVGIGEIGLDYFYDHAPREDQKICFQKHIDAALDVDLPIVVHTRDAEEDTINILQNSSNGNLRGVIHCFSGSLDLAKKSLDMGFYISFSGIITFKKADDLREIVKYVPLDRILVETDCPYLAPVPYRGKRNEPAYVARTAMVLSDIKEISIDEVSEKTTNNFFNLFSKAKR